MEWHILHREIRGLGIAAERDSLDLNELWMAQRHQVSVAADLVCIPCLHQREAVHGALSLWVSLNTGA